MHAAQHIVSSLKAHDVKRVYCVPGESYLALLDALYESGIEVIVCRHEGGAGFMACAEAKLTGRPGVLLVSRGPGATNASIAVHMAEQDALPLLVIIGQVSREERTRAAFQEVNYQTFYGDFCKEVFEPFEGEKLFELMPRALRLAAEGVPGPVAIAIPEDVLNDEVVDKPALRPYPIPMPKAGADDLAALQSMIEQAERPLFLVGARLRGKAGARALTLAAEAQRIPVAVTWRNQDVFDNGSKLYAGHIGFGNPKPQKALLAEADLIIAIGTRAGDVGTFHFTVPEAPQPRQRFIHIYPDSRPIGRVTRPDFGIIADPVQVLEALGASARVGNSARETWISKVNHFIKDFQQFNTVAPDDGVDFGAVIVEIEKRASKNCIIATDSGNAATWVHRHWRMTPENTLIGGIVGAMGLSVPGVVAAQLIQPDRMAIAVLGDGAILMTGQELAVAKAHGLAPKIVLSDNGIYGTIRAHQEREFPGRVSGTNLSNPDFSAWARSFGADGFVISTAADIVPQVDAFLASTNAAVLHVKSSKKALSAYVQLKD